MPDDEEIDIRAEFHDEVSRPANTAAASVDNLGDEARETAAELAMMGAAADDAGDELDDLGVEAEKTRKRLERQRAAIRKTELELKGLKYEQQETKEEVQDLNEELKAQDGFFKKLFRTLRIGNPTLRRASGGVGLLGKLIRFGLGTIKWALIATGVSFLTTALGGLGAAAYAGVAGLSPLVGVLVTMPSLMGAVVQGAAALVPAVMGMGELFKVLGDSEATAEEIEAALAGMHQNQVLFARAVLDSRNKWKGLKKEIGGRFFEDLDDTYDNLVNTYFPILDLYLNRTATSLNRLVREADDWLQTGRGQKTISDIMEDNVYIIEDLTRGTGHWARILLGLTRSAGPMLREMAFDFRMWSDRLADSTEQNQSKLTRFFNRSYDLFQRTGRVLGSYMTGLFNIGKQSDALSGYMGDSLEEIGQNFERWTESREGKRDIRRFFRDMIPIVRELGLWMRDLAGFLGDITMDNDDFVTASRALRTVALPALATVIKGLTKGVVPTLEWMGDIWADLKESGAVGGTTTVLRKFVGAIAWSADKLAQLPDSAKNIIAFASGVAAAYGIMKRIGPMKGVINWARGRAGLGVQKVFVTNWPPGMGGTDVYGAGGGGDGKSKKPGKFGSAARKVGRTLPFVGTAMALYGLGGDEFGAGGRPPSILGDQYSGSNLIDTVKRINETKEAADRLDHRLDTLQEKMRMSQGTGKFDQYLKRVSANADDAAYTGKLLGDSYTHTYGQVDRTKTAFERLMDATEPIPSQKFIKVDAPGADSTLSKLQQIVRELDWIDNPREARITITKAYSGAGYQTGGGIQEGLYTGGLTEAGKKYLTGELGPEAWVSRSGAIKMLGLHGPEVVSPGSGAVVPASATQDPYGGARGLAPDWAVQALRGAVEGAGAGAVKTPPPRNQKRRRAELPPVNVGPIYATSDVDVERAVRKGIADAQRDAEERQ